MRPTPSPHEVAINAQKATPAPTATAATEKRRAASTGELDAEEMDAEEDSRSSLESGSAEMDSNVEPEAAAVSTAPTAIPSPKATAATKRERAAPTATPAAKRAKSSAASKNQLSIAAAATAPTPIAPTTPAAAGVGPFSTDVVVAVEDRKFDTDSRLLYLARMRSGVNSTGASQTHWLYAHELKGRTPAGAEPIEAMMKALDNWLYDGYSEGGSSEGSGSGDDGEGDDGGRGDHDASYAADEMDAEEDSHLPLERDSAEMDSNEPEAAAVSNGSTLCPPKRTSPRRRTSAVVGNGSTLCPPKPTSLRCRTSPRFMQSNRSNSAKPIAHAARATSSGKPEGWETMSAEQQKAAACDPNVDFVVDKIVDYCENNDGYPYQVAWEGWEDTPFHTSWEPMSEGLTAAVKAYEKKTKKERSG